MKSRGSSRARVLLWAVGALLLTMALLGAAPALGAAPYWQLSSSGSPTNLPPGGEGKVILTASNQGDAVTSGAITVSDKLPAGLKATAISGSLAYQTGEVLECSLATLSCTDKEKPLQPATGLKVTIKVQVTEAKDATLNNEVSATGGGAPTASITQPLKVSSEPAPFGVEKFEFRPEEENGALDVRAGSHPFQLTTTLAMNETASEEPVALPKTLQFELPAGLIGNPTAVPQCSQVDFNTVLPGPANLCGPETAVGVAEVTIDEPTTFATGPETVTVPIFNLEPAPGEPARFGLDPLKVPVVLETKVLTSNYHIVVTATSTDQAAGLLSSRVTFWGVPGDHRHDVSRGWECAQGGAFGPALGTCKQQQERRAEKEKIEKEKGEGPKEPRPFLQLPTSCATPWEAPMKAQSWMPGAGFVPSGHGLESEPSLSLGECEGLAGLFNPAISVEPDTHAGSTPTGLTVNVSVPQPETDEGRAVPAVKETTVTLPQGVLLNPGAANGLEACSGLQMGFEGSPESAQTSNEGFSANESLCEAQAKGSKVGTVSIVSPDLKTPLTGSVYLASEGTNPFEPPLVLYLVASSKESGVRVKLAGKVTPNPVTGQLVSTFENTPQVPFTEFSLHFFDGGRASVSTPPLCGSYQTTATFVPWSGTSAATPTSNFEVTSGPAASGCSSYPQAFSPRFEAGVPNLQAGAFTPFSLTIGIPDGSQSLVGLSTHLPEGMAAMLSSVTPCPIAQADAAQCGPESLVGHSSSVTGLGSEPFTLPGSVYLTGPYNGAPFGLSVATPAVAGPFNLGTVIANSTIEVDPNTAAVTVTARETRILDPRGATTVASSPLPTIIKGVPVALKAINVTVDRPNFQFNPTSCAHMEVTGTLAGSQGATVPVSAPFQVANCGSLPFAPKLTATTNGAASKVNGTNLNVTVTSAGLGQANIAKVFLQLPAALPSRLTTIQKACPDTVFNANPASCGEGSLIGHAAIHTPVLKGPLSGPAYLVSHGNAAFPDVEFVLQGEGILLVLDGKTDIKKGITYSRFESAPDAPFTTFETTLPAGPHSALTAYTPATPFNVCKTNLEMPTEITGQNGAVIKRITKIGVQNCGAVLGAKETALQKALKACKKKYKNNKKKRQKCEAAARKKYAPKKAKKNAPKKAKKKK